jgi:hypothetical protein
MKRLTVSERRQAAAYAASLRYLYLCCQGPVAGTFMRNCSGLNSLLNLARLKFFTESHDPARLYPPAAVLLLHPL